MTATFSDGLAAWAMAAPGRTTNMAASRASNISEPNRRQYQAGPDSTANPRTLPALSGRERFTMNTHDLLRDGSAILRARLCETSSGHRSAPRPGGPSHGNRIIRLDRPLLADRGR